MPAVCSKLVEGKKCGKKASYNIKGNKAEFCLEHKQPYMANVSNAVCSEEICIKRAYFNIKNGKPKFCSEHKEKDMIDTTKPVCIIEGCIKRGLFKLNNDIVKRGENIYFCSLHKPDSDENIVNSNHILCKYLVNGTNLCKSRALYNYMDLQPAFCSEHKKQDMLHIFNYNNKKKAK